MDYPWRDLLADSLKAEAVQKLSAEAVADIDADRWRRIADLHVQPVFNALTGKMTESAVLGRFRDQAMPDVLRDLGDRARFRGILSALGNGLALTDKASTEARALDLKRKIAELDYAIGL